MTRSSTENSNNHDCCYYYDVVIIGAGMAGLAAGEGLRKEFPELSMVILEARDRIGGRTWTQELEVIGDTTTAAAKKNHASKRKPNKTTKTTTTTTTTTAKKLTALDMGATWIHGEKNNPIAKMAKRHRINLWIDHNDDMVVMDDNGREVPDKLVIKKEREFRKIIRKAQSYARICNRPTTTLSSSISIREAIQHVQPDFFHDPILKFCHDLDIEFDYGGPSDQISAIHFDQDEEFRGNDALPAGGFQSILQIVARGLAIHTNVPVRQIQYTRDNGGGGATIETTAGIVYRAKKVICTVPLGVLKRNSIQFAPQLSQSKLLAIQRIGLATVHKIGLVFDKLFWPKRIRGFGLASSSKHKYIYVLNKFPFTGDYMLEAYAVGDAAAELERRNNDEIIQEALNSVYALFQGTCQLSRDDMEQSLVHASISKWGQEEFTLGAYSFAAPETEECDFASFLTPELDVLFFAGEHTSPSYRGTVHGAYMSGRRAARQIIKQMETA